MDDLKKQCQTLTQRIEQTRANLAIQAKYRDAAISMSKLYSPNKSPDGKRRSLLGNRNSGGDSAREADLERQASEKRCEELASELFSLEKRLMEPQRRLLEHTAGILQMTHRAPKRPNQLPNGQPTVNGIPGSPESLYTYTNGRNSLDPPGDDPYFDDRSLYLPLDQMDGQPGRPRKNTIEIPMKSPVREQNNQLREESDRLKEENKELRATSDAASLELEALRRQNADQLKSISYTERKLEGLNERLRDIIVKFNPAKNANYKKPPSGSTGSSERSLEPGDLIASLLDYLQSGLTAAQQEQELQASESTRESEAAATAAAASLAQAEGRIEALNRQVQDVLRLANPEHPSPPDASGSDLDGQLDYLQMSLRDIENEVTKANDLSGSRQKAEQVETVLTGLWDIIQTGYAGIERKKAERRRTRIEMGLGEDEDDISGDESLNTNEPYSLQAFSTKVQWLYAQATSLKDQKSVLKRQIKQQRELNNKSDSEKELELKRKMDELQQTKDLLDNTEREAKDAQEKLSRALQDLDTIQKTSSANQSQAAKAAQDQLKERNAKIAALESSSKDLQGKLAKVDGNLSSLQSQLKEAGDARKAAEASAEKLQKEAKAKDGELDRLNMTLAELKTEATIAKAELEGAYGSRAQRAAEAAALTKNSENSEMAAQVEKLKAELASTLKEFEDMTKETITAEKEKLELEGKLDDALAAKASLETETRTLRQKLDAEVSRLQEQLDGERLKVGTGQGSAPRAGASMLSEQFRATMKEERKKFQDEMRVSHHHPVFPISLPSCVL